MINAFSGISSNTSVNILLRIQIVNIDDQLPYFPHSLKEYSAKMTTFADGRGFLGKIHAFDEDSAPFNNAFYSLLPQCSDESSQISLDGHTGELFAHNLTNLKVPEKICILASASKPDPVQLAKISQHDLDAFSSAILRLQLLPNPLTTADQPLLQMPLGLIRANNSHSLLEHQLLRQTIPIQSISVTNDNGLNSSTSNNGISGNRFKFALDFIEFLPYGQAGQRQKIVTLDLIRPLVGIDPENAQLRFDPAIAEAFEDGLYKFGISVEDGTGNKAKVYRNIHFLDDKLRLRFRFNEFIHTIGSNLTTFIDEIEKRLQGPYKVVASLPVRDEGKLQQKSSMCFHLWSPTSGAIVQHNESVRLLSTNVPRQQQNELLSNLYTLHHVTDIEHCEDPTLSSSNNVLFNSDTFGKSMLQSDSKRFLYWAIVIAVFALMLSAFVCYVFVVRRNGAFPTTTDNPYSTYVKSSKRTTPSSVFSVPEFIHPKSLRTDELEY
uniref:Peptidase S72 domain-containing protein n=1 Tax=Globodera rostochiensis TaxID=31243 RepID=A0A914I7E6_GLORO